MQDIHMIGAAGGIFTGGGGVGSVAGIVDRRLRQNHLHQNQALKCPRCDSLNTKFCYYNNYNLSQPRHFCKACRRYWTKGGVLRNVPVGGGCRKSSKRSSSSSSKPKSHHHSSSEPSSQKPKSNSNSSSESSSLTGTTAKKTETATTTTADLTAAKQTTTCATKPPTDSVSSSTLNAMFGYGEQKYIFPQIRSPNLSAELMSGADGSSFTEIGNFSNFMTSSTQDPTVVNMSGSYEDVYDDHQMEQWHQLSQEEAQQKQEMEMCNNDDQFGDPTVQIDQSGNNGGLDPLGWQQQQQLQQQHHHHEHMFSVDQGYWSQQQWSDDADQNPAHSHLYLP